MKQQYDSARASSPVFVIGYMHSGTTMLLNIIRNHSAFFSSHGETKYFDYLPQVRAAYPCLESDAELYDLILFIADTIENGWNFGQREATPRNSLRIAPVLDQVLEKAREQRDYGTIFRLVFDSYTQLSGKARWLEKTPTHVYHVDRIVRSIPDSLFVEIVRDPRDVLASKSTRRKTVWSTDRYIPAQRPHKHLEKAYDPFWDALAWKSAIVAGRKARTRYQHRVLTLRYEDLVDSPEAEVRAMCDFLDLQFGPHMLDVSSGNPADCIKQRDKSERGIRSDSRGRWRTVLTPPELALCQLLCANEMSEKGYERAAVSFTHRLQIPIILMRSVPEFVVRLSRRWRLGGTRLMWNVLGNYLKRFLHLVR